MGGQSRKRRKLEKRHKLKPQSRHCIWGKVSYVWLRHRFVEGDEVKAGYKGLGFVLYSVDNEKLWTGVM